MDGSHGALQNHPRSLIRQVSHLVTTSESLSISVAIPSDLHEIEPAWWRLLNHQQSLDYRGSERELSTQINTERVRRFLDSRIRQGRLLIARFDGELIANETLIVRAGGHINGKIRYGRIVIESGGEVVGDMEALEASSD